jgi:hypothetical protein
MRTLCVALAIVAALSAAGCGSGSVPEADRLPSVTLTSRDDGDDETALTFLFTKMERANFSGKALRVAIVKSGEKPSPDGPFMKDPPGEVSVAVRIGKVTGSASVIFVPMWGPSSVPTEFLDLAVPGGGTNTVSLPALAEHRVKQITQTCTGPNRPIPFDPEKGIDLITVGYAPDAYSLRIWAERHE